MPWSVRPGRCLPVEDCDEATGRWVDEDVALPGVAMADGRLELEHGVSASNSSHQRTTRRYSAAVSSPRSGPRTLSRCRWNPSSGGSPTERPPGLPPPHPGLLD